MVKRFYLLLGLFIGVIPFVFDATVRSALGQVEVRSPFKAEISPPICYLQLEGSGMTDVTSICGKNGSRSTATTDTTSSTSPTIRPAAPPPPSFAPAATAGKCNFLDANGKPCPKTDAAKPDVTKTELRISL